MWRSGTKIDVVPRSQDLDLTEQCIPFNTIICSLMFDCMHHLISKSVVWVF